MPSRRLHKRQLASNPITLPSALGLTNVAITATNPPPTASILAVNPLAPSISVSAPSLGIIGTTLPTVASPSTPAGSAPAASQSVASSASSTSSISINTVIGACVGAFLAAFILIIFGVWMYKRYAIALTLAAKSRALRPPPNGDRNAHGEIARRRSKLEHWGKLDDDTDKWEGMYQTSEVVDSDNVAPMEKLTMFKKSSPSVRTAYTHTTEAAATFDFPFLTVHKPDDGTATSQPYLSHVDPGSPISWNDGPGTDSFLSSLRTKDISGGAKSPTLNIAIPTPSIISPLHRWESAEVHHVNENDWRGRLDASSTNPFFNNRSHPSHTGPETKGKNRARTDNPFSDNNVPSSVYTYGRQLPRAPTKTNERAIQSLIAALDVSSHNDNGESRVASLQPSVYSTTSAGDEIMANSFPLPPNNTMPTS